MTDEVYRLALRDARREGLKRGSAGVVLRHLLDQVEKQVLLDVLDPVVRELFQTDELAGLTLNKFPDIRSFDKLLRTDLHRRLLGREARVGAEGRSDRKERRRCRLAASAAPTTPPLCGRLVVW